MSDLFRDRSCMHWWLPSDEGYPPIIRSIRKFVEERTAPAKDLPSEDLRDMKAIFASLNLDNSESSLPLTSDKEKGHLAGVVADDQDWAPAIGGGDMTAMAETNSDGSAYALAGAHQKYWSEEQGGGSYGVPRLSDTP